ncbi:MAG: hypothetical protein VB137_16425 [Burkholderia sp.]
MENRTWATNVRGAVLIHAGRRFDRRGYDQIIAMRPDLATALPAVGNFEMGGVVGWGDLDDCLTKSGSPWFTVYGQAWFRLQPRGTAAVRGVPGRLVFSTFRYARWVTRAFASAMELPRQRRSKGGGQSFRWLIVGWS